MAEILAVVAAEVGKGFAVPIKKQFNYICCFNSNIKELTHAAKALNDARAGVQIQVDLAKRNRELILPQVETWLTDSGNTQVTTCEIETQVPGILNLKSRYSLSRKAKKTAESMNKLRDTGKFDLVSQPALPASMGPTHPPRETQEVVSRRQTEDDIIMAMRDGGVNVVGLWDGRFWEGRNKN